MHERCWQVGELAAATGLTVRTLRHFDQIGLLRPALRSPAGHRVYTTGDVRRLYRILALRQLGLPLNRIARSLDGGLDDLGSAVRAQLAHVEGNLRAQHHVRARLAALLHAIDEATEPTVEALIETMEALMQADHFTPEQLAQAKRRHTEPGFAERFAAWLQRGTEIATDLRAHLDRGTNPADPAVQDLARCWTEVMHDLAGRDPEVLASIYAKIEAKGPETATRGVLTTEIWDYLKRAFAVGFGS